MRPVYLAVVPFFAACAALSACGTSSAPDGGPATDREASVGVDAAVDASIGIDAAAPDALVDAAIESDASAVPDAGVVDTGLADTGLADTGLADTGLADTGLADTGLADTGAADTGVDAGCAPLNLPPLALRDVAGATMFTQPLAVAQAPGSTDTLWVVERGGRIRLVRAGATLPTPFLDLSARIAPGTFNGLLGLAFHPDYALNGRFFVYYTAPPTPSFVVAEYRRSSASPDLADATEVRRLVEQPAPGSSHNAGTLAFGRDGFLYVAVGEGASATMALDPTVLLGKVLRLDVDNVAGMFAAAGNPSIGAGGRPQLWAYGLRNPWRLSIDRMTGDLYVPDVGEGMFEEINIQGVGAPGGANYGWPAYNGNAVGRAAELPRAMNHSPPTIVVAHGSMSDPIRMACAITGGVVYRGATLAPLRGAYLLGDYCSADVAAVRWCGGASISAVQRLNGVAASGSLVAFGEDNSGEVYLVLYSGRIAQLVGM